MLLSFPDLSSWCIKHSAHPAPILPESWGESIPRVEWRGVSIAAAPLSPTWLSEALYLSPICMIPQTLDTYYEFGTVLLDISVAFEQIYEWMNRWMTLIELVSLSPSFQFFSFISAHFAPDLVITQRVLVTEYAGNCRNYSRWKWEKSISDSRGQSFPEKDQQASSKAKRWDEFKSIVMLGLKGSESSDGVWCGPLGKNVSASYLA